MLVFRAQALPSSQFTNPLLTISQFELERSERCWQWSTSMTEARAWLRNSMHEQYNQKTFTNLDYICIILHETTVADFFLSNHSTIHWSFNHIARSTERVMVFLKHSWNEKNNNDRWEITHRRVFVKAKKVGTFTSYEKPAGLVLIKHNSKNDKHESIWYWNPYCQHKDLCSS